MSKTKKPVKVDAAPVSSKATIPNRSRVAPSRQVKPEAAPDTVRIPVPLALGLGVALLLVIGALLLSNRTDAPAGSNSVGQVSPVSTVQGADYHSLAVSPMDANKVWFGSHDGIQESTDGGKTWQPLATVSGDAMSMAMPPADPSRVYIAGHNIFKRSSDGGKTWQDVQTDLPGLDIHGFAADPSNAEHVYALVAQQGLFESADGGSRWQPVPAQPPGAGGGLAVAPGNPNTLFAVTALGVMRSKDAGKSWHPANSGLPQGQGDVRALMPVPGQPEEIYAGTSDGLYHTRDGGTTWTQTRLGGQNIVALAVSQSGPLRVYVLTLNGAVFRLEGADLRPSN